MRPLEIKRISRNPEKFEVLGLFEAISRNRGLKFNDPNSQNTFFGLLSKAFGESSLTPTIIHGLRIESMFEYVAASLGNSVFIKREDAGDICSSDASILPPDFRLVLENGNEIFVEVKNCHKRAPSFRYEIKSAYLKSLESYASLLGRKLWFAIFWSRWKKWTLVSAQDFKKAGKGISISFLEAIQRNQMELLGDLLIATMPPLSFRLISDPEKPRMIDEAGNVSMTIRNVELYCNGQRIEDHLEQQLAFYFMLHSNWVTEEPRAEIIDDNLMYIEYVAQPQEHVPDQGFQMLGYLSDMISRHYNDLTAPEGEVALLSPAEAPGSLGVLIPPEYKGKQLPIWYFSIHPDKEGKSS